MDTAATRPGANWPDIRAIEVQNSLKTSEDRATIGDDCSLRPGRDMFSARAHFLAPSALKTLKLDTEFPPLGDLRASR